MLPIPCGLQSKRLEAYVRKHGFDTPVANSGGTHKVMNMRLDAIYTRSLTSTKWGVERVGVSDHRPLWTDISI